MKKVSIIIPAHNEESCVYETLKTALAQDYPDFEVIVVDNASTDKTAEIVKQFPKVKIVYEKNKGTQWARERGRLEAVGEILAFMDADCLPYPDWLSKGVKFFTDEKVAAVGGFYDYFDATPFFRKASYFLEKWVYTPLNLVLGWLHLGGVLIFGNTFIRASVLQKIGGFDTRIVFYGDDTDTAKRISKVGKIIFTGDISQRTSARRFKKQGIIKTLCLYLFHFFKITILGPKRKNQKK